MAWTYGADPLNDPTDEVHFLAGDTDPDDPLLQDEEIALLLAMYPKPVGKPAYLAAAAACDAIAARFGRQMQRSIGDLAASAQQKFEHYLQLAAQLRAAYMTDGEGLAQSPLRVRPASPVLGGGGQTYLDGGYR